MNCLQVGSRGGAHGGHPRRRRPVRFLVATLAGLTCLVSAATAAAEPTDDSALFQVRSEHAYSAVFGVPAVAARPVQSPEWQISLTHSNLYMGGTSGEEQLLLDGETTQLTLRHRRRLSPCWQGELVLPFIQHSNGVFDRAIDNWHQYFGLPDAQRGDRPFDRLYYGYTGVGGQGMTVDQAQSGPGDIHISAQRSLGCESRVGLAGLAQTPIARIGVKLPTGSLEELRGSGQADVYADVQSPVMGGQGRWRYGASLGVMHVGQTDQLAPQKSLVAFGALGTQFILTPRYRLLLQFDWHTPFYDSQLRELGDPTIVMSMGLRFLASRHQVVEISFSEDVAVDTSPDISVRLAWIYRPGGQQ